MSMEITGNLPDYAVRKQNYSDYGKGYTNTAKESNVTTSTVELKTSTGGTKTEQIKTGYSNVNDYSKYLQGKYSYMNSGTTSMQGVPTTVSVSGAFLKKCMNDPEKAKYLEENLAALPDCAKSAVSSCRGTLTNLSYSVDANGNISVAISGTSDPDGKIAKENAERRAKEKKAAEEKAAERRKEKKAEVEKAAERRAERKEQMDKLTEGTVTVSATGTNVKSVTQNIVAAVSGTSSPTGGSFDIKA